MKYFTDAHLKILSFGIILFAFEAKIHIPKVDILRLMFNLEKVSISQNNNMKKY